MQCAFFSEKQSIVLLSDINAAFEAMGYQLFNCFFRLEKVMRRNVHIVVVVVLLFCLGGSGNIQYTIHAAAASERTDDFRETEVIHLLPAVAKVSKTSFFIYCKSFYSSIASNAPAIIRSVQWIPQPLRYLRLRVLRN
jgi:hypothetical protein